jgi:hypothetical protein
MSSIKTRFDAVAARKYTTRDGQEKTQWVNVGRGVEWDDGGVEIELNAMPCFPGWNGKIKLFVQKERQQVAPAPAPPRQAPRDDFQDDTIPF